MTVWLSRRALRAMRDEGTTSYPLESGGNLLGWRAGSDRIVIDILGPGPEALYGHYRFLPDHAWQVAQICRVFKESGGDIDYLGDWHSHPNGIIAMSSEDHKTLRRISRRVHEPLMLILGGDFNRENWMIGCWKGHLHRKWIRRRFGAVNQTTRIFEPLPTWPAMAVGTTTTASFTSS